MTVNAYAAHTPGGKLEAFEYELGALRSDEVDIEVMYCGICHSDLSMLNNDWRYTTYPFVPGHEVVGKVINVGDQVKHLKPGQNVGLGWTSGSCSSCDQCVNGYQQLCSRSKSTIVGRHGGFANKVRAQAMWTFALPDDMDLQSAGPLFCGGITVFSPLLQHKISPLDRVGVIGIGGLGHMALAFLNAWGCEVTAFSTSPEKEEEARKLGAHHFVSTHDKDSLKALRGTFDFIIDTVNADLDWNAYVGALKPRGVFHIVGVASEIQVKVGRLMGGQKSISASPTGSPGDIRSMVEFAARHKIQPMVEMYKMADVNEAMERLRNGKPKFRVVLES